MKVCRSKAPPAFPAPYAAPASILGGAPWQDPPPPPRCSQPPKFIAARVRVGGEGWGEEPRQCTPCRGRARGRQLGGEGRCEGERLPRASSAWQQLRLRLGSRSPPAGLEEAEERETRPEPGQRAPAWLNLAHSRFAGTERRARAPEGRRRARCPACASSPGGLEGAGKASADGPLQTGGWGSVS